MSDVSDVARRHAVIPQDSLPGVDRLLDMSDRAREIASQLDNAIASSDWRGAAIAAEKLRSYVDDRLEMLVREMRSVGRSWATVGEVLGCTRQAAHERYRHLD